MRSTSRSLEQRLQRLEARFHRIRQTVRYDRELERAADAELLPRYFGRLEELARQADAQDIDAKTRELAELDAEIAQATAARDRDGAMLLLYARRCLELEVLELTGERTPQVLTIAREQALHAVRVNRAPGAIPSDEDVRAILEAAEVRVRVGPRALPPPGETPTPLPHDWE